MEEVWHNQDSFKSWSPAKLSNWWRRALSRLVTKNLMVTLVELHDHICRWEKPTDGQTSLQHSTDLGFMVVWPNSILSSVKTHENTFGTCKMAPKGPSDCEKQDYLVWWTSVLSIMFEGNQCSGPQTGLKVHLPTWQCPQAHSQGNTGVA